MQIINQQHPQQHVQDMHVKMPPLLRDTTTGSAAVIWLIFFFITHATLRRPAYIALLGTFFVCVCRRCRSLEAVY